MEITLDQALQQAVAAHREGNAQEAERLYLAILQAQPDHPDANNNLGILTIGLGKTEAALPLFKKALEANRDIEQFWLNYIDCLIKLERLADAAIALADAKHAGVAAEELTSLEEALLLAKQGSGSSKKKHDTDLDAPPQEQIDTLFSHYQSNQLEAFEQLAISMTETFPAHQIGWKALGVVLRQTGRLSESVAPMQRSVALSPQDPEAHNNLGVTLQELGRLDEAEACYQQAIALQPDLAEAHYNLGNTRHELGRSDAATASYQQAIALQPNYIKAHSNLGNALQELGRLEEAEESYQQAIALQPDFVEAHSNLGNTLKELGRLDEAEASCRQAIALKPDYAEAHYNLGVTLKELGRLDEAEASYRQAITLKPDYAEVHYNLGNTLLELGRLDEAEASYRQAITLKPGYAEARNNLGNVLKELERLDEAEASYRHAIMLKPDFAEAHNNLGNALTELGRLDEAEASCKQAIAIKPDFTEAHINLGIALRELGELEHAETSYNRAIALNSGFLEAYTHLGSILIELERLAEAETSFRQAIVLAPDATEAQEYLLKCLYWQCKKSDFLDQLELLISRGQNNAVIGSMARHATLEFGVETANPFCNAPLNYVQHTQLNNRYDFGAVFVKTSLSLLATDKFSDRSQGLLINGSQTSGNLFRLKSDSIDEMERIIRLEIERYRLNFQGSSEGFLTLWPSEYTLAGWLISMNSGGKLDPHIHERGWLSGSVYINVPPRLEPNDGNFNVAEVARGDITNIGLDRMDTIKVETGSLVLFPSSLTHYTTPFHSDQKRVVLAFDVRKQ